MKLSANVVPFMLACALSAASSETEPLRRDAGPRNSVSPSTSTYAHDATRKELLIIASDRHAETTPILARKHAEIRAVMDDKTKPESMKTSRINAIQIEYDARIATIYDRSWARITDVLSPRKKKSNGQAK